MIAIPDNKPLFMPGPKYYQDRFAEMTEGTHPARLVREPTNTFDPNAIMVMRASEDTKIGYVPRWKAKEWAPEMDNTGVTEIPCTVNVRAPDPDKGLYSAEIIKVGDSKVSGRYAGHRSRPHQGW